MGTQEQQIHPCPPKASSRAQSGRGFHASTPQYSGAWRKLVGQAVLVCSNNATVVAYINHQGGTRSARLCALAWDLIHWCMQQGIALSAVYIPGKENVTADALSRGWIVPTEWSLCPYVAQSLFLLIDRPHVDLFASRRHSACGWESG